MCRLTWYLLSLRLFLLLNTYQTFINHNSSRLLTMILSLQSDHTRGFDILFRHTHGFSFPICICHLAIWSWFKSSHIHRRFSSLIFILLVNRWTYSIKKKQVIMAFVNELLIQRTSHQQERKFLHNQHAGKKSCVFCFKEIFFLKWFLFLLCWNN